MTLAQAWFISVVASMAFVSIGGVMWLAAERWVWLKRLVDRMPCLHKPIGLLFLVAILNVIAVPVLGLIVGSFLALLRVVFFVI